MTKLSDTRRLILPRSCTRVGNLAPPLPKGLRGRGGKYIGREADQARAWVSSTLCSTPVPMLTDSPVVFSISADNSTAMIAATRAGHVTQASRSCRARRKTSVSAVHGRPARPSSSGWRSGVPAPDRPSAPSGPSDRRNCRPDRRSTGRRGSRRGATSVSVPIFVARCRLSTGSADRDRWLPRAGHQTPPHR